MKSSLGKVLSFLLLLSHDCDGFGPFATRHRTIGHAASVKRTQIFLKDTKSVDKRAISESITNFRFGVWSCLRNYWTHYARQAAVGTTATLCLTTECSGRVLHQPLVRFLGIFADSPIVYWWNYSVWSCTQWVGACIIRPDHRWARYGHALLGAPVVEEIFYRLFCFQCLKAIFRKFSATKESASSSKLLTPCSVIVSVLFAIGHIDAYAFSEPNWLSSSMMGRIRLARITKLVVEAFFGSLFIMTPLCETHGVWAAIGAHGIWNVAVFFPGVRDILLTIHFLHRLLWLRTEPNMSLAAVCEMWLEFAFLSAVFQAARRLLTI